MRLPMSAPRFLYIIISRFDGGVKELIGKEGLRLEYRDSTVGKIGILLSVEKAYCLVLKGVLV